MLQLELTVHEYECQLISKENEALGSQVALIVIGELSTTDPFDGDVIHTDDGIILSIYVFNHVSEQFFTGDALSQLLIDNTFNPSDKVHVQAVHSNAQLQFTVVEHTVLQDKFFTTISELISPVQENLTSNVF